MPPHRIEIRYKKDQDKQFYQQVDIFKTIVTAQGHLPNNCMPGVTPPTNAGTILKTRQNKQLQEAHLQAMI